jgi:hypothetical protein
MSEISTFCQIVSLGKAPQLWRFQSADGQGHSDVAKARLRLRVHTNMAVLIDRSARLANVERGEAPRKRQMGRCFGETFLDAPALDQIVETGALAVGSVAVIDEQADDRDRRRHDFWRQQQHTAVAREDAVARDAAEQHPEINPRRYRLAGSDPCGGKADVVGIRQDAETTAAIERDIELARQAIELAMIKDVVVKLAGQWAAIDQFLRIDTGAGAAGQVANVVGAGAARGQPKLVNRRQHGDRMLSSDLADLQIGSGRDVEIAAAVVLGDRAQAPCLIGR